MLIEDQTDVISLLSRADTFGPAVECVQRIDTHASAVFLAGDRAYKLKRAVRYPYLDYSTLDKRETFCRAELEINRRAAPSIYLGVLPVTEGDDGNLRLNGEGRPVDWVIEMACFAQDSMFDVLAERSQLDRFAMEHLADRIAQFHDKAEVKADGGARRLGNVIESNCACFDELASGILDPALVNRINRESADRLQELTPVLDKRAAEGKVRHCHGDLHLRNIVAHKGEPVLFDAIEFDPAMADIDVLYDLAFLMMDLEFRGLRPLASIVLNRYLDVTGDAAGMVALPLFLSVRAAIRSHISAAAAANQTSEDAVQAQSDAARRYLDLALAYLQRQSPRAFAVGGYSGSGKSRLARNLAPLVSPPLGVRVVRTDATRKRLSGVAMLTRLGTGGYTAEMTVRTYEAVFEEVATVLACGHSVIADAVFLNSDERDRIAEIARKADVPFHAVWLETTPEALEDRVSRRKMNISDATAVVVRMQLSWDPGDVAWPHLDTSGHKDDTLSEALRILGIEPGLDDNDR
jgi:aminoglycoside phosphotransferase family enzyme/predicted kinase